MSVISIPNYHFNFKLNNLDKNHQHENSHTTQQQILHIHIGINFMLKKNKFLFNPSASPFLQIDFYQTPNENFELTGLLFPSKISFGCYFFI